jgi:hypothetical protein
MAPSSRFYEEKRQREEERRQKELQRRKEEAEERLRAEEKERQREEERREEARRAALEFEAALEKARLKREETLARLRQQKQVERKETDREMKRRDDLLAALREANREKEREEIRKERVEDRKLPEKETPQTEKSKEVPQDRLKEKKEALRQAEAVQERRKTALEETRKEAAAARKQEFERQDKNQVQKKQAKDEMRGELVRQRLEERKRIEKASQEEEKRRAELIKERAEELSSAQRAEERRAAAIAGRTEMEGQAEKEAQRREEARRQRLEEQKQQKEKSEKEAERREQLSREKETIRRFEAKEERPRPPRQAEPAEKPTAPRPLESRLPSGVLSGSLPWLLTYDNRIVTTEGEVVFLRGINLPGLDAFRASGDSGPETVVARINQTVAEILSWGANIIRLGINPFPLLGGAVDHLELLDAVIAGASSGSCYTVIYLLETPGDAPAEAPYLSNLPHDDVIGALRILAERYASEPAVLIDLGCPPKDMLEGETPSRQTAWAAWNALIPNLVADLRIRHPRAFCFVGGLDRATDVTGFPVTGSAGKPIPGLAYTANIYPAAADPWTQLKRLAVSNPVFVSEWGGTSIDAAWGERVAVMMETMGIGWAAAFWTGELALVRPVPGGRTILTPFGAVVRRALALASQRAEASQLLRFSTMM